jgi:tetratricopeptide (TPR) repeat protein
VTFPALPPDSRLTGLSHDAIRNVIAAAQALEAGRVAEAERYIGALRMAYPGHAEVLRLHAGAQTLRGDNQGAITTMHRAVAQRPRDALYRNTLGAALLAHEDYDGAVASLHRAVELDPKLATAWYNLGLALMRCARPAQSADAFRRALALAPANIDARAMLADMLKASGEVSAAIDEYRRVLAQTPTAGMAWWGLADIKTIRLSESDIVLMRQALSDPGASDDDRIAIGFALAKALDDHDQFAPALAALDAANAIARQRMQWNAAAHTRQIECILTAFGPAPAGVPSALGSEAIFIASLPRSGSTLIEQILASHTQVEGAGELPDVPLVLTEESRRRGKPFPEWIGDATDDDWRRLGLRYLERTARWRERRPRFTDKLPGNWPYIGAIRAMLPGARIIVACRDPLETCLSIYRQRLVGNEYSRTFADLAAYWKDFDRATERCLASYPGHVYKSVYEELIRDPEMRIRALLDFCGLAFEAQCLQFHRTERDIHTPSAMQVREPLRRNTARSARYGALLDPLRAALGLPNYHSGQ